MLPWAAFFKELGFNSPTSYWVFSCFLMLSWGRCMTGKLIPKVGTYLVISVSLKTEKWISTKMKNEKKIHICLVNYICNFLLCISLCYNFLKNISYR